MGRKLVFNLTLFIAAAFGIASGCGTNFGVDCSNDNLCWSWDGWKFTS